MFISQTALTKNAYSADPAWKTLSDPADNADEDAAGDLPVKPAPLLASAENFLTKRRTMVGYDVRSLHHCVKEVHVFSDNSNQLHEHYVCHTHSTRCAGHGRLSNRCELSGRNFIPALNKALITGCRCQAD